MWQRFTENARKAIFHAQEEAQRHGEGYVSTEHVLIGILRITDCVAYRVLVQLGASPSRIEEEVESQMPSDDATPGKNMSLTPRAKRVIDLAYDEARNLDSDDIGTEHLLLGLIREGQGLAGRVLERLGVRLDPTRSAIVNTQGPASARRSKRRPARLLFGRRGEEPRQDQDWVKPIVMEGYVVRLEPLSIRRASELAEACDPEMFQYFPTYPLSFDRHGLQDYISLRNGTPLTVAYSIVHKETGKAIGSSSFFDIRPADRALEIGHTWIKKEHRGTKVNPETKLLMLGHAFETLEAIRVQLKTDLRNVQSQKAMLKLGAKQEGILRHNMLMPDGHVRDSVYFSVLKEEWPSVKSGLLVRLKA
jgi:RimJ/RimL family protein N-acetyltransferase